MKTLVSLGGIQILRKHPMGGEGGGGAVNLTHANYLISNASIKPRHPSYCHFRLEK